MGVEIVTHGGEYACGNIVHAHSFIIERRTGDGNENEYHIIYEKRREDYKRRTLKLAGTAEEIEQRDENYHRIVRGIAHVHHLTEKMPRHAT